MWQSSYWKIKEDKNMRHTLQPLTEKEQRFAEESHNLIYKYLREHGYSIEEYYDVALFGFLKSVQAYHRKEKLKGNYNFSTVAYKYMRAELSNDRKIENAKKRIPKENMQSMDTEDNISRNGKSAEDEVIAKETLMELLEILSDLQRKIFIMIAKGYSSQETISSLDMKRSTYYKELRRIKSIMESERY